MKAEDQSAEREAFEKWAREEFVCHEYSFASAQPYGYINTIQSKTFAGRVNAQYADVQMLWLTWRGALAALSAREAPAREGWQLVPKEPTPEMIGAMAVVVASMTIEGERTLGMGGAEEAYVAMLAASPQAPTTDPAPPAAKAVEMDALSEFLEFWTHEGRLQTFEDRERFRGAARALLGGNHG